MPIVKCDFCGIEIERSLSRLKSSKNHYCCPEHQRLGRRKRVYLTCDNCGKVFERALSRIHDTGNYCSVKCVYEARKIIFREPPLCRCGCGQPVKSTRNGEWCKYIHGHNFRGKKHTTETREKIRQSALCQSERRAEHIRGENNPMWRGGHRAVYAQECKEAGWNWWHAKKMKKALVSERGHKCERCGATDIDLELHHIDHNLSHNQPDNFQLLCHSCHVKITYEFIQTETTS